MTATIKMMVVVGMGTTSEQDVIASYVQYVNS